MEMKKIKMEIDEAIKNCYSVNNKGIDTKRINDQHDADLFYGGIKTLMQIIKSPLNPAFLRSKALFELCKIDPDFASECLIQINDTMDWSEGEILNNQIDVLRQVVKQPIFNSEQRYRCAVNCYNCHILECCNEFFEILLDDITVMIEFRVECSKFLYYTEDERYIEKALRFLKEVVENKSLTSVYRYETIASFITETGISTRYNTNKLPIIFNEQFVLPLQTIFFFDRENGVRERLLSGQYLLQSTCKVDPPLGVDQADPPNGEQSSDEGDLFSLVEDEIYEIAKYSNDGKDADENHRIRADAADILIRLGSVNMKNTAAQIISELGEGDTLYTNKENIHNTSIQNSTNAFLEDLIINTKILPDFEEVHKQITHYVSELKLSYAQQVHVFKSLNRICIDTATFTKYQRTIPMLFCYIWVKIQNHEFQDELNKRLVEELIDMADTCSTGHISRLVNVFSGYEASITINIDDQLKANIDTRFNAKIKNLEDEELKGQLICGMTENVGEDRNVYLKFMENQKENIRQELYSEFVTESYIKKSKFNDIFESEYAKLIKPN